MNTAALEQTETLRAAGSSAQRGQRIRELLLYSALPLVVFLAYTNLSDVLIRNFSIPSILQPMIVLMAIPVLRYHHLYRTESVLAHPLTIGVLAYCLLQLASSNWAHDLGAADATVADTLKNVVIMIVIATVAASWRALRGGLIALVAGAAFVSALTLIQVASGDPNMQFGGLAVVDFGHLFGDLHDARPGGPVGNANYYARVLLVALPMAALLGVGASRRYARGACMAAAAAITFAILLTYSRGGILAMAGVAVLLVLAGRIRVTLVNALIAAAIVFVLMPTNVGKRVMTMVPLVEGGMIDDSADKRWLLLEAGFGMWNDHPAFGVGAGNFGRHYPAYANLAGWNGVDYLPAGVRQYPHNLYLEIAVETGIVGLLLFVGIMGGAILALYQSRLALLARGDAANAALVTAIGISIAGYLAASIFLHSGYQRYLWLVMGFAIAALRLAAAGLSSHR